MRRKPGDAPRMPPLTTTRRLCRVRFLRCPDGAEKHGDCARLERGFRGRRFAPPLPKVITAVL